MDITSQEIKPQAASFDPNKGVTLNYRYISAWNEINSRIAQRQNAITVYLTGISALTAIISFSEKFNFLFVDKLIWLTPVITSIFILLSLKHEFTIGNLRSFLMECEKFSFENFPVKSLPAYHYKGTYFKNANFFRYFHDIACIILMFFGTYVTLEAFEFALKRQKEVTKISETFETTPLYIISYGLPIIFLVVSFIYYFRKYQTLNDIEKQNNKGY